MPSKTDPMNKGQANPQGQPQAEAGQLADTGQQLVLALAQINSTLQTQNELLKIIQSDLQTARNQATGTNEFQPGSAARNAADVFNGVVARLNFIAPTPDAPGQ